MKFRFAIAAFAIAAGPAFAQDEGDAAAGEAVFRQCIACHVIQNDEGELLAGRAGRTGPNLFGVFGREAGSVEGFRYTPGFVKAGEMGLVWDAENMKPYLHDPTAFLREFTGDSSARSNMTLKLRNEEQVANVIAYMQSLMPEAEAATN